MTPTKTRQLWSCCKCGYVYASPVVVERAYCPRHRNGAPAMKLEEGQTSVRCGTLDLDIREPGECDLPGSDSTYLGGPAMGQGTRSATKRKRAVA